MRQAKFSGSFVFGLTSLSLIIAVTAKMYQSSQLHTIEVARLEKEISALERGVSEFEQLNRSFKTRGQIVQLIRERDVETILQEVGAEQNVQTVRRNRDGDLVIELKEIDFLPFFILISELEGRSTESAISFLVEATAVPGVVNANVRVIARENAK